MSESSFKDIKHWLDQVSGAAEAPTPASAHSSPLPPPTSSHPQKKKKRRASIATARDSSPSKRPRIADDRTTISDISLRSTTSTTSRQVSPSRDILNQLRLADPPVIYGPLAVSPVPESIVTLRKRLADGFGHNIIPRGLESRIRAWDSLSADDIPETAYCNSSTLSDASLDNLWAELKTIFFDARQCDFYNKDENAWCLDVVQPLLNSSIQGFPLLQLVNVQSQQIDPSLLPRSKSTLGKLSKKTDYTLSFACRDALVQDLYNKISLGGHGYEISQTTDAFTKRIVLFSGMEVKSEDGGKKEALAQLAIWLAAGLEKTRQLGAQVKGEGEGEDSANWLLPSLGLTIIGHDWYVYLAYKLGNELHVVGPVNAVVTDTRTIYGILKVRDLIKRVAEYASQVYWPWIRDEILQPLAA
ncbi:hypothetical protein BJY00DRAFT_289284 [Aspergillus carlsbadensis]|nr:hypothetical protein BJY00DRAFT_289284 [Aspergillus carlsbadensis]